MNLIVIMTDSLRKDHVGAYGNKRVRTPGIDKFAAKSLVFERAFPEGLPTINVRRALFTGRRSFPSYDWAPWKGDLVPFLGWQPLSEDDVTLTEVLRANGYVCGLVADSYHMFKPRQNFARGFHAYTFIRGQETDPWKSGPVPDELVKKYCHPELDRRHKIRTLQHLRNNLWRKTEEDYLPARVFRTAAEWLEENRSYKNLFLWVDCFDPHEPWDSPKEYVDLYDPGYTGRDFILPQSGDCSYMSPAELNHCRANYAGEVTFVDKWFGWFMERVEELGLMENSVILFLADHGHPLGEHGIISKNPTCLYPELVDVPFMLRIPGRTQEGSRTNVLVQFHDVAPTLLDALGVAYPADYTHNGQSFLNALAPGVPSPRDHFVCGYHDSALVEDGEWSYIFTQDPSSRRLFNIRQDPDWRTNLYADKPVEVRRLHSLLLEVADPEKLKNKIDFNPIHFFPPSDALNARELR